MTKDLYLQFLTALGTNIPVQKCLVCRAYVMKGDEDARCKGSCHQFRNSRHILQAVSLDSSADFAEGLTHLAFDWLRDAALDGFSSIVGGGELQPLPPASSLLGKLALC